MDDFEWNVVNEGYLLDAMVGHKPVGKQSLYHYRMPTMWLVDFQTNVNQASYRCHNIRVYSLSLLLQKLSQAPMKSAFWIYIIFVFTGVNKYFQMAFICEKFIENSNKDVDSEKVWAHLETMYNLEALDESESIPFPNNEREFQLPESDFGNLINKKDEEKNKVQTPKGGRETPKLVKEVKKEEKTVNKTSKERRDSKEGKDLKTVPAAKKEMKKDVDKLKTPVKGRASTGGKEAKSKPDDQQKTVKRPTRGSLKPNDDSSSSGKSSPVNVTPTGAKRRRI